MAIGGFRLLAAATIACASITLPATGNAAITVGPPNIDVPYDSGVSCSGFGQTGTCSNLALPGGALAQSPIDGVVVRWRAKSFSLDSGDAFAPTFRIVRSVPGGFTGAGSSGPVPAYGGAGEFPARLPIRKDDYIGIDLPARIGTCRPCVAGVSGGGSDAEWRPALIDNELPGRPPNTGSNIMMLINADVEPDTDGDSFGDETQDKCLGSSGAQDGCPAPAAAPQSAAAPRASLSGSTTQDVLSQGAVIVFVTAAETGSANATGTINVPGVSKTYKLSPASSGLSAGIKTRLKLKLSRKTKRALRRALRKGKKPKASIDVTVANAAGGTTAIKRTVRVKRKKR